ncbi:hypothetical protein CHS0354_007113 [Potamilus streckersoni]|uniref:Mitochondria-eating protein C-terminal domain-containing protein n=1 Tax=Potamilus streckersoni TaxID=2493646 RepID=A0AAE0T306_9BIVA|nr:hypothetical protein CHS0354_007113 [Potamilus streckersoni]
MNMGDLKKTLRVVNIEDESAVKLQVAELRKWIQQTMQKLNGVNSSEEAKKQIALTTDEIKAFMNYEAIETFDSMKKAKFLMSSLEFVTRQLQESGKDKADLQGCLMSAILNLDCLAKSFQGNEEEKNAPNVASKKDFKSAIYHPKELENTVPSAAGLASSGYGQMTQRAMDQLRKENEKLKACLQEEKHAKEDALTRLSHFAANKMKSGNPDITDLSDPNRPSKLAEDFGELYCNEWTDALEYLQQKVTGGNSRLNAQTIRSPDRQLENQEKGSVNQLFEALKICYDKCTEAADQQRNAISKAVYHGEEGLKEVSMEVLRDKSHFQDEKMKIYVEKCIQLCWFMRIQFPPIYLEFNIKPETDFDANLHTRYISSGNKISFPVWPIMFLHERNGVVLKKGVVECTKGI